MNKSFAYLPPDKRKKIMLICDDIRVTSGVAAVAKDIVIHTAQHFNWVNLGGAITHPEAGKRLDLSQSTNDVFPTAMHISVAKETMSKVGDIPLAFEPGTKWMYGLNTDVLGRVVEVASGEDLDDYIREKITKPLGIKMLDFYFNWDGRTISPLFLIRNIILYYLYI